MARYTLMSGSAVCDCGRARYSRVQFDQFSAHDAGGAQVGGGYHQQIRRRLAAGAARPDAGRCL